MKTTARDEAQFINRTVLASTISALLAGGGAAQAQESGLEEITVTGSRIVRRDLDAASPIVTIDTDRLENSSTIGIESVLNQMPQFVPEGTQFDSGNTASGAATLGIASVNLRGIGANRTLVLVDGRRAQPANASLVVDLNTIPSAAIERVETITGGASAVYGADALAGVVNFVLRDDFEGVEMDFHTGVTAEGDGEETRFSTLLGVNGEGGNSNVMLGVEWYRREAVYQIDREFFTERVGRSDQPDRRLSERVRLLAGCRNSAPRWPRQRGTTDRVRPERPDPSRDQRVVRALRHRGRHRAPERRHLLPAGWPAVHLAEHSGLGGRHQLHRPAPELREQQRRHLGCPRSAERRVGAGRHRGLRGDAGRAALGVRSCPSRPERQPVGVRPGNLQQHRSRDARRLPARDHRMAGAGAERRAAPDTGRLAAVAQRPAAPDRTVERVPRSRLPRRADPTDEPNRRLPADGGCRGLVRQPRLDVGSLRLDR